MDGQEVAGQYVSQSQLGIECLLALKFSRERIPWLYRSVALAYGTALHAGLERWLWGRDLQGAIKSAHLEFMTELGQLPEIRFDSRFRRGKKEAAVHTAEDAERLLEQQITAWHLAKKDEEFKVLATEKVIWVRLGRPEGWKIQARLDAVVDTERGREIWDWKSSSREWSAEKLENSSLQAHLYLAAETRDSGIAPERFRFIVLPKGTDTVQELTIDFDTGAINRLMEFRVRPTIAAIEAGAWIGNTTTWMHHPDRCNFWYHCPLGAAAQAKQIEEVA